MLPDTAGQYALGAYVNYDCPRDSMSLLLDYLCQAICPQMAGESQIVSFDDADPNLRIQYGTPRICFVVAELTDDASSWVYADAVRHLKQWQARGIALYVFSSGSVQAQRLLFGHSDAGDLTPLFSGFYDTRIGAKREASAYTAIAADIGLVPADVLFLSDIEGELDAARSAGMQTLWLVRDAEPDPAAAHRQVKDFDAIPLP